MSEGEQRAPQSLRGNDVDWCTVAEEGSGISCMARGGEVQGRARKWSDVYDGVRRQSDV